MRKFISKDQVNMIVETMISYEDIITGFISLYDNYLYQNIVLTKQILKCLLILTLDNNNDKSIFDEIWIRFVKKGNGLE